jgi:glycosyltransferase involved in cell wall biosynthesis
VLVGFDAQIFGRQRRGGISRYFVELIAALSRLPEPLDIATPFRWVVNDHLLSAFPEEFSRLRTPLRWAPSLVDSTARFARGRRDLDVLHHTYYDPRCLADASGRVRISTVHDMIPERFGSDLHAEGIDKRRVVLGSDAIICVSRATAEAVVDTYGTETPPISVIHLGVNPSFFADGLDEQAVPSREALLYVGVRRGYKDFDLLLKALAALPPSLAGMRLVCVGGGRFTREERSTAGRLGVLEQVQQIDIAEQQLPATYAAAAALVVPSQAEGFGLPVLEALAAGCPVIASDLPVFHETAEDVVRYFPVGGAESLTDAIVQTVGQASIDRQSVINVGREHAKTFSWARAAQATLDVYAETLNRAT